MYSSDFGSMPAACIGLQQWRFAGPRGRAPAPYFPASALTAIPDQYIVLVADTVSNVTAMANRVVTKLGGTLLATYDGPKGFAIHLLNGLDSLRSQLGVKLIEQDETLVASVSARIEPNAPWQLDRLDQRDALPFSGTYSYFRAGGGVFVYVIDSGIRTTHDEFQSRAVVGVDFVKDGLNGQDCNGHGTAVASLIGGLRFGVAKSAILVSVRVLDCNASGTKNLLLSALAWVRLNHRAGPAVVNLSIQTAGTSVAIDQAERMLVASGVSLVVAAGNGIVNQPPAVDACTQSPAREPTAITVSATTIVDSRWSLANFGPCVDLFAPGDSVSYASFTSDVATGTGSGTSFAAPLVAGAAALLLEATPLSPAQVASELAANATQGKITDPRGSPNALLFAGVDSVVAIDTVFCNTVSLVSGLYTFHAVTQGIATGVVGTELSIGDDVYPQGSHVLSCDDWSAIPGQPGLGGGCLRQLGDSATTRWTRDSRFTFTSGTAFGLKAMLFFDGQQLTSTVRPVSCP
jgi:subtilisin family serine protease